MVIVTVIVTATVLAATMAFGGDKIATLNDGAWSNPATWDGGALPTAEDTARIVNDNDVTLGTAQEIDKVIVGRHGSGDLTISSSGSLTGSADSTSTIGQGDPGTFVLDGGQASLGTVEVGNGDTGLLTINSGTFVALDMFVGTNGVGTVDLMGGSMTLTNTTSALTIKDNQDGMLNIENNAELILAGDQLNNIDSFVTGNDIAWDNGSGIAGVGDNTWDDGSGNFLHSAYDVTEDETTVWANTIPEPATLWVLVVAGVGLLMVRRRRTSVD